MNRIQRFSLLLLVLAGLTSVHAQIKLQPLFSDNMVLQRNTTAPLWGEASPNVTVDVVASWDGRHHTAQCDAKGRFKVNLETPEAGGPYTIDLVEKTKKKSSKKRASLRLSNVMVGEVWLCSGQSNMQFQVGAAANAKEEVARANCPNIRLLKVEIAAAATPRQEFGATGGGWQVCSPETAGSFSAAGYFFGRQLTESLGGIPIGLIDSSLGSTFAETWASGDALSQMPYFHEALDKIAAMPDDKEGREKLYVSDLQEWNTLVSELDGNTRIVRQEGTDCELQIVRTKDFADDEQWLDIEVPGLFEDQLKDHYGAYDGIVWYRRMVEIPSAWDGKQLICRLGAIDDDDVVFFNGTQIGATLGVAHNREYLVPASLVKKGKAEIAVRVNDTGGLGGFYTKEMRLELADGSDGLSVPLAGKWRFKATVDLKDLPFYPTNLNHDTNVPTALFNGMIAPLIPYALRGAIWYQGESSVGRSFQYRELLPLLIDDWRSRWGNSFPFYMVQLANYMTPQKNPDEESTWAEMRESQMKIAQNLQNCGMAVTIDIGEAEDIHPKNKQEVGRRLALVARANTYGQDVEWQGPLYSHYTQEGKTIRLHFTHATSGLTTADGTGRLRGFVVAGPDRKFHWADAVIDGNTIVVSSSEVDYPMAVRYAWADNPSCNLSNGAGLPASPFRTDDWPALSQGNY